mmetsp:Transcript_23595/g.50840  ORF Transcript_23595/g.50840 Transcript_23595/m.50840 type:complete len:84 (-) Transcript_23595:598-849(-)
MITPIHSELAPCSQGSLRLGLPSYFQVDLPLLNVVIVIVATCCRRVCVARCQRGSTSPPARVAASAFSFSSARRAMSKVFAVR